MDKPTTGIFKFWVRDYDNHPRILIAWRYYVSAGDGGGAVRAHLDSSLDLLDAMPVSRRESRQWQLGAHLSCCLRLFCG